MERLTTGFPGADKSERMAQDNTRTMHFPVLLATALATLTLVPLPASAKVVAEGKPSPGGFYWQKVEKSNGSIQYLCRNTSDSKIQKAASCNGAKAVKPQ